MAATNVQAFSGDVEITSNLAVNTNDLFVNTVTGNVGIGMASPQTKLHVQGPVYKYWEASGEGFVIWNSASYKMGLKQANRELVIFTKTLNGDGDIQFSPNDSQKMVIKQSGNVGINTTSPASGLHVRNPGGADVASSIIIQPASTQFTRGHTKIEAYPDALFGAGTGLKFYTREDSGNNFDPTSLVYPRMTIRNNGYVGIGTEIPSDPFTITAQKNCDTWTISNTIFKVGYKPSGSTNHYGLSIGVSATRGDGVIQTYEQSAGTASYDLILQPNGGNVGLGELNPTAGLHISRGGPGLIVGTGGARIYGIEADVDYGAQDAYFMHQGVFSNPPYAYYSLYLQHWARAEGYTALSDSRIKNNIADVDDSSALETLRALQPKYYNYIDTIGRGSHRVIGFLAQEVKQVCPFAVSTSRDYIPNIYELANISDSNVITFTNFNTSGLESNASVIKTIGIGDKEHIVNIAEVVDERTIRVEEDLSEWTGSVDETGNVVAGNQLFVYGQEVDDFHNLNKDALFSVATASIQEIDRQLQAEKAKITTLDTQVADLLARVQTLESA